MPANGGQIGTVGIDIIQNYFIYVNKANIYQLFKIIKDPIFDLIYSIKKKIFTFKYLHSIICHNETNLHYKILL